MTEWHIALFILQHELRYLNIRCSVLREPFHINRSFIDPPSKMQASRIIWDLRNTSESLGSLNIQDPNFWLSLSCVSTHTLYFLLWHNSLECLSMMVNAVTLWILSVYISILVTIQHYWGFSKVILHTHTHIYIYIGLQFAAQVQIIWDLGPMSPIQWICREWVKKLSPKELGNG